MHNTSALNGQSKEYLLVQTVDVLSNQLILKEVKLTRTIHSINNCDSFRPPLMICKDPLGFAYISEDVSFVDFSVSCFMEH